MPEIIGDFTVKVIGAELVRDAFAKQAEAMASIFREAPQSAFATALNRRKSHRDYCQVRAESIYGLKPTLAEVAAQWAEKTTDIQDPPNEVLSSSLRNHGPPSRLVSKLSYFPITTTCGLRNGEPQR